MYLSFEEECAAKALERTKLIESLSRVMNMALDGCGTSRISRNFLLSLYNGDAYPFNMNELRNLDRDFYEDFMTIMKTDCRPFPPKEIHTWWDNGNDLFETLKKRHAKCDRSPKVKKSR